jgi:hypothetical protein
MVSGTAQQVPDNKEQGYAAKGAVAMVMMN